MESPQSIQFSFSWHNSLFYVDISLVWIIKVTYTTLFYSYRWNIRIGFQWELPGVESEYRDIPGGHFQVEYLSHCKNHLKRKEVRYFAESVKRTNQGKRTFALFLLFGTYRAACSTGWTIMSLSILIAFCPMLPGDISSNYSHNQGILDVCGRFPFLPISYSPSTCAQLSFKRLTEFISMIIFFWLSDVWLDSFSSLIFCYGIHVLTDISIPSLHTLII